MKAKTIIKTIEEHAPKSLMLDFDSAGLNVGSEDQDIDKVLLCENVTMNVIKEAIKNSCQMIISHHPVIFGETLDSFTKDLIEVAQKNRLVLYSAHTNLDAAKGGINDRLCEMLGITEQLGDSCYRIGKFVNSGSLGEKAEEISKVLKDSHIRTVGDKNRIVKSVCVSSGAGGRDDELVEKIKDEHIDVLIGGENKISLAIKMQYYDICLIEVGHYTSEIICEDIFSEWLKDLNIEIMKSKEDINPYND